MFVWLYFLGYLATLYAGILWLQQQNYIQPTTKEKDDNENEQQNLSTVKEIEEEEEVSEAEEEVEEVKTQNLVPSLLH